MKKRLRLEVLEKLSALATAGFGLVAALAWNSAVQELFKQVNLFGSKDGIVDKFLYAVVLTIIVVVVTFLIGRSINSLKDKLKLNPKEEEEKK